MQVTCERCAGVDVGKGETAAAVRLPGKGRDGRKTEKRKYRAFYGVLREVAGRLESLGVTHVAMEATGTYPQPAYCALAESGSEEVLACNAGHVKNVPGRKTGLSDAGWLAQLLECGLVRGSFIPRPRSRQSVTWSGTGPRPPGSGSARSPGPAGRCRTPGSRPTRSPRPSRRGPAPG
jgi:transposase